MSPLGTHHLLELHGCPPHVLNDLDAVLEALAAAATRSRSTLLTVAHHRFDPEGLTAIALLAESHISLHTWPELGYAAADVFTCGEHTAPELACQELVERMAASRHVIKMVPRGDMPAAGRPSRVPLIVNG